MMAPERAQTTSHEQFPGLSVIESELRLASQQPCGKLEWLQRSYQDPDSFWQFLKGTLDARYGEQGGSILCDRYNFFHDIIVRNRNNPAAAFCWYDTGNEPAQVSYPELGALASTRAACWSAQGLKPGQTVVLIRPMGIELVVDLLAALKAGAVISLLPPRGRGYLKRRLEALQPDHLAVDERMLPTLGGSWSPRALRDDLEKISAAAQEQVHAYRPGQAVFRCFDPCGPDHGAPVTVSGDAAYLCALRDGLIGLGLSKGAVYTAPGFDLLETQPFLLLAGLLCGATFLHLRAENISARPAIVTGQPIRAFGVSRQVRDLLLELGVEVGPNWQSWFRNPGESHDLEQWHNLVETLKLKDTTSDGARRWEAVRSTPSAARGWPT